MALGESFLLWAMGCELWAFGFHVSQVSHGVCCGRCLFTVDY